MLIDNFFDSLQWKDFTSTKPTVDLIIFGDLMEMVDSRNRWAYKGSNTIPPCQLFVYWNVLSTIYPMKQKHLTQFKKKLAKAFGYTKEKPLNKIGNWRETQTIDEHDVIYI